MMTMNHSPMARQLIQFSRIPEAKVEGSSANAVAAIRNADSLGA